MFLPARDEFAEIAQFAPEVILSRPDFEVSFLAASKNSSAA